MRRFERRWVDWDRYVREGERPGEFLSRIADEALLELLATAGDGRRYERNLVTTEALNRMRRTRREIVRSAADVRESVDDLVHRADEAATVVHASEAAAESDARERGEDPATARTRIAHAASAEIEALRDATSRAEEAGRRLERLRDTALSRARDADE